MDCKNGLMIILTNLQATATCKTYVLGVHTEICKYQIYYRMEFGIEDYEIKIEYEGNDEIKASVCCCC